MLFAALQQRAGSQLCHLQDKSHTLHTQDCMAAYDAYDMQHCVQGSCRSEAPSELKSVEDYDGVSQCPEGRTVVVL